MLPLIMHRALIKQTYSLPCNCDLSSAVPSFSTSFCIVETVWIKFNSLVKSERYSVISRGKKNTSKRGNVKKLHFATILMLLIPFISTLNLNDFANNNMEIGEGC